MFAHRNKFKYKCGCSLQCARVEKNVAEMWDGATEEVQNDYGKEYVDIPYKLYLSYMDSYDANNAATIVTPVIDAFVDALINVNPLPRYLIGGGFGWYDPLKVILLGQMRAQIEWPYIVEAESGSVNHLC